jgi:hypothetical protein
MRGCCRDRGSRRPAAPPHLRQQLWCWLDAVVDWLVTEYVWDVGDMFLCVGRSTHIWCTRLRFRLINADAPVTPLPATPWRSGTATICPRSPSGLSLSCGTIARTATSRGRREAATPGHMAESSRRTREDRYAADVGSVRPTEAKGPPSTAGAGRSRHQRDQGSLARWSLQHRPGHAVASKGRTKPAASSRSRHDCPQQRGVIADHQHRTRPADHRFAVSRGKRAMLDVAEPS